MDKTKFVLTDKEMIKFIESFELDRGDIKLIKNAFADTSYGTFKYYEKTSYKLFLEEIYILIGYTDYTPQDIATAYNMGLRNVQMILKRNGWALDKNEAQRRATLKRDYKTICIKGRQTRNKATCGSNIEEYIRNELYCSLQLNNTKNADIIVGINSTQFIDDLEADIPIIIISNGNTYKFAVEVDGVFWHNKEKDNKKDAVFEANGYRVLRLKLENSATHKYIDSEILSLSREILKVAV